MEEVLPMNIKCYYGTIYSRKNGFQLSLKKYNYYKLFETYEDAFHALQQENQKRSLIKNLVYVYHDNPDVLEVHIPHAHDPDVFCLMDNDEHSWNILKNYTLNLNSNGYVRASKDGLKVLLHHLVLNFRFNKMIDAEIDHINHEKWDNRNCNLRVLKKCINHINRQIPKTSTTNERNIHWDTRDKAFIVQWRENMKTKSKSFTPSQYNSQEDALNEAKKYRDEVVYQLPDYKVVYG